MKCNMKMFKYEIINISHNILARPTRTNIYKSNRKTILKHYIIKAQTLRYPSRKSSKNERRACNHRVWLIE